MKAVNFRITCIYTVLILYLFQPIFVSTSDPENTSQTNENLSENAQNRTGESLNDNEANENRTAESSNENEACENRTEVSDNCDMCNEEDIDPNEACCVCQSAPIYYTLLPCRHACVCSSCIKLLDRCPMCRAYINAYFRLADRSDCMDEDSIDFDSQPLTRWQAFNQRMNEMLGFT